MSNALLLRLFTSEFFNSWIAVSYLFRYPDNVGIQHYLCNELKSFPMSEIEFFLPQLVHLLISRPSESVALECFILDQCQRSTHMALMTLWYLQAYLSDCSSTPTSPSFMLCKRVFNKCQAIVFSDGSSAQIELADSGSVRPEILTNKVKENVSPALVGMAAMLAGIGQPLMTKAAGQIAIAQGRRNRALSITEPPLTALARRNTVNGDGSERSSHDDQGAQRRNQIVTRSPASAEMNRGSMPSSPTTTSPPQRGVKPPFQSASQPDLPIPKRHSLQLHHVATSPSLEDLHRGKAFSVGRYLKHAQQKINRKINPSSSSGSLPGTFSVFDPSTTALAKSTVPTVSAPLSPSLSQVSSEEIFFSRDPSGQIKRQSSYSMSTDSFSSQMYDGGDSQDGSDSDDEISTLSRLSVDHRRSLLRSNYFNSEMQFLLALVDIATRLVIVPKHARVSSLHAELTLLNHNLPAEICVPLWCPATMERPHHHRVVRISPSDAVVLNSAERAPYLLLIEVLDDDLSFDDYKSLATLKKRKQRKAERKRRHESARAEAGELPIALSSEQADDEEQDIGRVETTSSDDPSVPRNRSSTQLPTTVHMPSPLNTSFTPNDLPRDDNSLQSIPSDLNANPEVDQQTKTASEFAERMRTAAIMLAQLQQQSVAIKLAPASSSSSGNKSAAARTKLVTEGIRQRIIKEMMALEDQRMAKMRVEGVEGGIGGGGGEGAGSSMLDDESRVALVVNKEDPSAAVFAEDWEEKKARIRAASPYGHLPNWRLISVIVKNGADLRQEQFAIQLIREMQRIWQDNGVDVWVKYIRVLVTSDNSGLIETVRNSISIHSIKKDAYTRGWNDAGAVYTLYDYFKRRYGPPTSAKFLKAQDAFMRSLAAYSIACYILQIKDRHNGNILVDNEGHLIHIDFGFMLSNSPGSVGFEMAPFKLPQEYVDILGGVHGEKFAEYKAMMKAAFLAVRKNSENIILLVEMMRKDSKLPCFQMGELTTQQLRDRFQLHLTEPQVEEFVDRLIMSSCCNVFTRLYDTFQYYSQGIL
ncbi:hypothetical protein K450DRAFT_253221 [Umbelopsis ramanniana AG]|uniref:1-phosphatidylinositol 4-kinase n=1 Tax=Umbelopsis ramanniana AG TaxID=1314678 RepID=A0AAD5E5D8_UMBRA|nr:uncharacterized protein K450DRAFT_253221 [Umbelopsis ramanniana AG]KAI8577177.1 hypothetical protein K450DRAFT_253221 [Umbelopsis ramanniana AG]